MARLTNHTAPGRGWVARAGAQHFGVVYEVQVGVFDIEWPNSDSIQA